MKLLNALAITVLGLTFGANAFAQTTSSGLTHAEVIQQLQQAQKEGLVPTSKSDYPPSDAEIARNREIYAIQHHMDGAGSVNTAGAPVATPSTATN